jgi:TPR repeat protein
VAGLFQPQIGGVRENCGTRKAAVKIFAALVLLLTTTAAYAALPAGVTSKTLPDNVVLYERQASVEQLPSFWDTFFSLFRLQKDRKVSLAFGRSVALLVGIGNYRHLQPRLEYANKDVEKMRDYLLGEGGFDSVYVMDERATPQLVSSYMMDKFRSLLNKEDRLLFYFSGHGGDPGDGHPFLQFRDAQPGEWGHDVLRVDDYRLWSNINLAKHVLFIFDACFAGEALPKGGEAETAASISELSADGSRIVVTAGTENQRAWMLKVSSDNGYSLFTEALLRALRNGAADSRNRGFVTILQVVGEAQIQAAEMTRKLGPGHEMTPQPVPIPSGRKGTFVFLNPKAQKPSLPQGDAAFLGVTVAKGVGPEQDRELELAYWKSIEPLKDAELYAQVCQRFPDGLFCPVARKLMNQLKMPGSASLDKASLSELKDLADKGVRAALTQLGKAYESGVQGAQQDLKAAVRYYTLAVDLGDGSGAYRMGNIYHYGRQGIPVDTPEAVRWYQRGAILENADSLTELGWQYAHGKLGLIKDEHKAVELFQKAANLGHALGMVDLGVMYQDGKGGLAKDERKAMELYQKAADLGDALGMTDLGYMYRHGLGGLTKDDRKALELYQKAVDLGDALGMTNLGFMYESGFGGLTKDDRKAVELYQKAVDLGDTLGMTNLGAMYEFGRGELVKDARKAVELYQQAADLGNALGMVYLGDMYEGGKGGLAKDERKAVELYQKAADLGDAYGMACLGDMYEGGKGGLAKDERKAVELYQKAADLGSAYGMACLGVMYENSKGGLAKDERKAVELYQKAADLGNAHGVACLGVMYENGKGGLAKDQPKAVELYRKAADLGDEYASNQLRRLGLTK